MNLLQHKKLAKCNIFEIKIYCLQKRVLFKKYAVIQTHMCLKEMNIKVNFINATSVIWCICQRYKKQDIKSKQQYAKFFNITILFICCFKAIFSLKKNFRYLYDSFEFIDFKKSFDNKKITINLDLFKRKII